MGSNYISHGLIALFFFLIPLFSAPGSAPAQETFNESAMPGLVGTIISDDFAGAVLVNEKGEQNLFRVRDRLPDGSQIARVGRESILIRRNDGSTHELFILHGNGKTSSGGAKSSASAGSSAPAPASPPAFEPPVQSPVYSSSPPKQPVKRGRRSRRLAAEE